MRRNKFRIPAQCVPDFATLDLIACHLKLHLCLYVACLFIRQAGIYNLIFHVFLYTEYNPPPPLCEEQDSELCPLPSVNTFDIKNVTTTSGTEPAQSFYCYYSLYMY